MLKIYIGDTEVVSSNEISIKEEFLNPSSVILNNVMPKSWEDERNYTGFYHFKDYDKCRILDRIDHEEIEGTTVEGTSLSINYNNEYDFEYKLLGQTEQDGTPTPDNSYPIQVVTGDIEVLTRNKNLFNFTGETHQPLETNVTINNNELTIEWTTGFDCDLSDEVSNLDSSKTYTISFKHKGDSIKIKNIAVSNDNLIITGINDEFTTCQFTVTNITNFKFRIIRDTLSGLAIIKDIQIEEGTTATEYVEHQSQTYPISLGNLELCKIENYQDYIYHSNGNWYKKEYIRKVVLDGSEDWETFENASTGNTRLFGVNDYDNVPRKAYIGLSNYFTNSSSTIWSVDYEAMTVNNTGTSQIRFRVDKTLANSVEELKTWLSTHNTTVYYVLETPMDTQITDTTLINQLNNIALLNGTNNIVITGDDLPPIMNLHYNFKEAYTEENLLFCGVVKNSGNISLNPRYPHFSTLQVIDFKTFLSEGESLDYVISNKTVIEAIDQVISAISDYGFVLGNIQIFGADDVIGAYNCENKTAYDVFQYLSEITGSRWFTRMIDQNTVAIDFYDPTLMTSGQNIEYTQEWFENNNVEDLSYNYGTYDYRNKQIMESDKVFASIDYTENIVADGYAKIFQTSTSIGIIKSITAGGVSKTFATNSDKELGIEADFYYTPNEVNLETDATYSAGTVITIVYTPLVKGRRVIRNYDEITRIAGQTNRRGTIARYETRNDVTDGNELEKIGETYLKYKGSPEINLKLVVRDNDIYSIGQVAYFDAPLEDLQTEYLLKKKTTNIITDNNQFIYQYVYEFTSSFNVENEVNYFDNQRNKAKGNISEGEYIIRDVDIDEQANIIFHNLTISEVTVSDDNILEAVLESPLTK